MAGGTSRRKAPAPRTRRTARPKHDGVLGNDPFERGAAPRVPVAGRVTSTSTPAAAETDDGTAGLPERGVDAEASTQGRRAPTPTSTSTPISTTPIPPLRSAEAQVSSEPAALAAARAAASRLAGVERLLDGAIGGIEARLHHVVERAGLAGAEGELRDAIARLLPALRSRLFTALDVVRLLEPPGQLDRHGMDARFAARLAPVLEVLYSTWWRVEVRDAARVPSTGPAIVVANHAGVVPWDALVLRHALRRDHPAHRELRPLLDDRECALPIFGAAAIRAGAVRSSPEAAARILAGGDLVGVFPEGSAGARKPWRDRYRLLRFGRGGFAKLALRAGVPVVPCAIVGSEEASPGISRTGWLADRLGLPLLAANASLRIGATALVPLPAKWSLRFGEPLDVRSRGGPEAADDPRVVNEITERVRSTLEAMLDEAIAARSSIYL